MPQTEAKSTKKTHMQPLGHRVLVKRVEAEKKIGGILLPESAKEKPQEAEVIAIGSGKTNKEGKKIEIPVKVGDIVLMEKYSGQEITLDNEEYIIVRADDLIAIVK